MKNLLMLNVLLLSSCLMGQVNTFNDFQFHKTNHNIYTDQIDLYDVSGMVAVSTSSEKDVSNKWLVQLDDQPKTDKNNSFSTHILISQLKLLNNSTPFSVSHNATLERFIRVYLKDKRAYLNSLLAKSRYYFPVFESYLDKNDLPLELKYLAVVESALNPLAVSPSGAKGIWQFMYGTASDYKLHIDSYVDERHDPIKSTEAACAYLKYLHHTFGDWDLALAAYNSGPGNVKKAIKRAGGNKNYWEIRKYLPRETSSYVPAFYATMYLFSYADFHNLKAEKSDMILVNTDTLHLKGSVKFSSIQNETGIDISLLRSLNPQYKKDYIPLLSGRQMVLRLPAEKMPDFIQNETDIYRDALAPYVRSGNGIIPVNKNNSYLVKHGDNLSSIATAHGISLQQLKTWNGLNTNFLIANQRLVITDKNFLTPKLDNVSKNYSLQQDASHSDKKDLLTYVVQHGDTLFKISKLFNNVSITELRTTNNLQDINYLKPGMELIIRRPENKNRTNSQNKS